MIGRNKERRRNVASIAMLFVLASAQPAWSRALERSAEQMSWLDNGRIRLGVDFSIGGAITWLSEAGGPNMINSYDWGRQIQMSFYSGPVPFAPRGATISPNWKVLGWNPAVGSGNTSDISRDTEGIATVRNLGRRVAEMAKRLAG
jgi:hypothetical protein